MARSQEVVMSKVCVFVPSKNALVEGSTKWGELDFDLAGVLAELDQEERSLLHVDDGVLKLFNPHRNLLASRVEARSPRLADVVRAIREELARYEEEEQKRLAEDERRARKLLDEFNADPLNAFDHNTMNMKDWRINRKKLSDACELVRDDFAYYDELLDKAYLEVKQNWGKRIKELMKDEKKFRGYGMTFSTLKELATRHELTDVVQLVQEIEEVRRKESEAAEALREATHKHWVEWASRNGSEDLQVAIRDGYPLGRRAEREVEEFLFALGEMEEVDAVVDDLGLRTVPSKKARQVHEDLTRLVNSKAGICEELFCRLTVSKIRSVEIEVAPEWVDE